MMMEEGQNAEAEEDDENEDENNNNNPRSQQLQQGGASRKRFAAGRNISQLTQLLKTSTFAFSSSFNVYTYWKCNYLTY